MLFISRNSPGNNKTARRLISPPTVSQAAKNEKYAISRLSDEAFFTPRTHITHPSHCGGRERRPHPTYYRVRIPQHPGRRRTACHAEFSDPHHIYILHKSAPSPPLPIKTHTSDLLFVQIVRNITTAPSDWCGKPQ